LIELDMVRRMVRRGAVAGLVAAGVLWLVGGYTYALSGALGVALALGNLWLAARVIGGVADRHPELLMAAGMATFVGGLLVVSIAAFAMRATAVVDFPITGMTLIGAHLGLVLWEAATGSRDVGPKLGAKSQSQRS
jgi:hypothetical protein